jgi:trypsin-like peptidase
LLGAAGAVLRVRLHYGVRCEPIRTIMRLPLLLLILLVPIAAPSAAAAGCVDPATLAHGTVSIIRHFDAAEPEVADGLIGVRGTGWFLSPTTMVTVAHVTEAMHLSDAAWTALEIADGERRQAVRARLRRIAGAGVEKIAVIELDAPFAGAQTFRPRTEPLVAEERIVSLAYPGSSMRTAGGRFVRYDDRNTLAGTALLELYDGNDRLALDHGASGAPVLDCEGRVVAVVSNVMTTTIRFMSRAIRVSTAWQEPNVVAVPIQAMQEQAARAE